MNYGASSLPSLSAGYAGFVNGDTAASLTSAPTLSTTATAYNGTAGSASHVGAYATNAAGAVDPDYTIAYVPGTLTVSPVALTITASNASMNYGASSLPSLSAGYAGFVNGDTAASLTSAPTLATTATRYNGIAGSASHVGAYATNAAGVVDPDYTIAYVPGTLTVNPVALTITASNGQMNYGASSLPSLSAGYSGFVNGDTAASLTSAPTLATTATAFNGTAGSASHVGAYATNAAGVVDPDYTISYAPGTLTVNPVALTITASNGQMNYGASSLPSLSAGYAGFVNGDDASKLTTAPTLSTTATAFNGTAGSASHVGAYATNAAGAVDPDYTIAYVPGTLTVNPVALTITASNASMNYGGLAFSGGAGVNYSRFANGDTASTLSGTLSYVGTSQGAIRPGVYMLLASGLRSNNYTISFAPGILTIVVGYNAPGALTYAIFPSQFLVGNKMSIKNQIFNFDLTAALDGTVPIQIVNARHAEISLSLDPQLNPIERHCSGRVSHSIRNERVGGDGECAAIAR
jgi:hypothetical protein